MTDTGNWVDETEDVSLAVIVCYLERPPILVLGQQQFAYQLNAHLIQLQLNTLCMICAMLVVQIGPRATRMGQFDPAVAAALVCSFPW